MASGTKGRRRRWYSPNELTDLLWELEVGDLLEFDRDGLYNHWAVYLGKRRYEGKTVPCVVHLIALRNATSWGVVSHSQSLQKGAHEFGKVTLQPLDDVIMDSKVRINNCMDSKIKPFTQEEVVGRALSRCGEDMKLVKAEEYSAISYNCEHFATECRYGVKQSEQVQNATGIVSMTIGLVVAIVINILK